MNREELPFKRMPQGIKLVGLKKKGLLTYALIDAEKKSSVCFTLSIDKLIKKLWTVKDEWGKVNRSVVKQLNNAMKKWIRISWTLSDIVQEDELWDIWKSLETN